jgi:hypothetical protein
MREGERDRSKLARGYSDDSGSQDWSDVDEDSVEYMALVFKALRKK